MGSLQEFEEVQLNLRKAKKNIVQALHKFVFHTEGDRNNRQHLREFTGFDFDENDEQYEEKSTYVRQNLNNGELTSICILLGLNFNVQNLMSHIFKNLRIGQLLMDADKDEEENAEEENNNEDENDDGQNSNQAVGMDETHYDDAQSEVFSCASSSNNQRRERENVQPRFAFNFRDVEDSIRPFDGCSGVAVDVWIREFEEMAAIMNWDQTHRVVFAKKSLRGLAKLYVLGERNLTTWTKLKCALINEFTRQIDSAQIHQMLSERKMKKEESVLEYFYKMKDIAAQGSVEDAALIRHVIAGIKDLHVNKALLYGANNVREFKEKLQTYEAFTSTAQKVVSEIKPPERKQILQYNRGSSKPQIKCYNCGRDGHLSVNCRNKDKGTKCFRCNKYGHMAKNCKEIKEENQTKDVCRITTNKDPMIKQIKLQNQSEFALFDTGSKANIIKLKVYERLKPLELSRSDRLLTGFGHRNNKIRALGTVNADIEVDNNVFNLDFLVIPNDCMDVDVIIGYPICLEAEVTINAEGLQIRKLQSIDIMNIEIESENEFDVDIGTDISNKTKETVKNWLETYTPKQTKTTNVTMKITLVDEKPISSRPRRLPFNEREIVDAQIEEWLNDNVIENSESEFSSPVVLVGKKDGSKRLCVDYRRLNKVIVKDRFPLPLIDDQLDRLQDAKIFSTIDLKNGFFHVRVDEESRKYTAFVTHNGQYQFCKVPFGLCNSPAVFQRHINSIFRILTQQGVALPYVDDIIIPAKTEDEALHNLKTVLQQCQDYGLNINWKKSQFMKKKIEFLGHTIENQTITPSRGKMEAMMKYPVPTTLKQLESFLGLAGYFRKFMHEFAQTAKPLSDLRKNDAKFNMGPEQLDSFNTLKVKLSQSPVLKIFNQQHETELHTDASADGYGAILMQKLPEDGKWHPVYYMSKKTTDAESKYTSYELEILAVIEALKKFRVYLLGLKFKIITDCDAFARTMEKKDLSTRVARWLLLLQEYDYTIEHRSGTKMRHVDALSRYPVMFIAEESTLAKLAAAQSNDEDLKPILLILEKQDTYNDYYLKSKILYRLVDGRELVVVPKDMEFEIIRKAHNKGHFALQKTKNIIESDYYITQLNNKIERCILNCIECILTNSKKGKQEGQLHPIPKKNEPLHTYHIDHLGPLESTAKSYNHIFVVIDSFTKFCWLYPTKTITTREVIDKLQMQSITFGNPNVLISDRGTAFTSNEFNKYCEDEGIYHHKITTGLPRANGQVERLNSVIINVIAKLSIDEPAKWYKHVGHVQQLINATHNRSTNSTPFEILIGKKMRTKDDLRLKELIEEEMAISYDQIRQYLRDEAKSQIAKIQDENKHSYNLRRKPARVYKVGDVVAIKRTQFGGGLKLKAKFLGPYVVKVVQKNDTYQVEKKSNSEGPKQTTTCSEFMKPWPQGEL